MFCVTQGLSYIDKVALNYGNIYGLKASQNITTAQFAWYARCIYNRVLSIKSLTVVEARSTLDI